MSSLGAKLEKSLEVSPPISHLPTHSTNQLTKHASVRRFSSHAQSVGRTALGLIEDVAGQYRGPAAIDSPEPASFEDFFYTYGGVQLSEELEDLANECSRTCNKSRSKLEGGWQ